MLMLISVLNRIIKPYTRNNNGYRGGTVVKVLCYTSEGRWFDPSYT